MSKNSTNVLNKYPVHVRFIVKDLQQEKFNVALNNLIDKYDIKPSCEIISIIPDTHILEEKNIIMRILVPNNNKKEAEKFLLFCQEVFVKLGLDFYPSYAEAPITKKGSASKAF